jgi:alpha-L-rhamnosidase
MNSFAHYSFGAVYQWIVENVAGIRPAAPGYERITIAPQPGGKLTWARTTYHSTRGPIATSWRTDNNRFTLDVTIPANTTATVHLPAWNAADCTEAGKPLDQSEGVSNVSTAAGQVTLTIGSGTYRFASALDRN